MLYDTVYYLGYLFQEFLQDNPDLLEEFSPYDLVDDENAPSARHHVERRLIAWLDIQSAVTDPVQRAILFQMAQEHIQLESEQDMLPILIAP